MHTLGRCGLEVSALGLGCNNFGARLDEKGSNAVAEHVAGARGGNRPVANQCDWRPPPARAGGFQAPLRDGPGGSRYVGRSACWIGAKEEKEEMDVVRHRLEGDDNPPAAPRSATRSFSRVSTSLASGLPPASTGGEPAAAGTRLANSALLASWATTAVFDAVDRLAAIGEQCGGTLLDLAVGWLAAQPTVPSVLVGVTKSEQVTASPRRRQPSSRPVVADPRPGDGEPPPCDRARAPIGVEAHQGPSVDGTRRSGRYARPE